MSLLNGILPIGFDSEGRTLPYAKMYTYDAGTFTPKTTYQNAGLTIPNSNPIIADGSGVFYNVYFGSGTYKLVIADQFGVTQNTQDNYSSALNTTDLANINASIALTRQMQSQTYFIGSDFGAANHYVLTTLGIQQPPTAYSNGMVINFQPQNANSGASDVNVNSLGVVPLLDSLGAPLTAGFINSPRIYQFVYLGGNFYFTSHTGQLQASDFPNNIVTLAMMANGTANKLIGYDGSGHPAEISQNTQKIASGNISAIGHIDIVLPTYDTAATGNIYNIVINNFQSATNDDQLFIQLSSDGGSTWNGGAVYDWFLYGYSSGLVNSTSGGTGQTSIIANLSGVGVGTSNAAGKTGNITLDVFNMNQSAAARPQLTTEVSYLDASATLTRLFGGGSADSATYNAIRFYWGSGANFVATGKWFLYKVN